MKRDNKGFTIIEALIVLVITFLIIAIAAYVFGRITTRNSIAADAVISENLQKSHSQLAKYISENKAIPRKIATAGEVAYERLDNQSAQLCDTFAVPRSGENDSTFSPGDFIRMYFGSSSHERNVYRDDVDFYEHGSGRNCYKIGYAPISVAYEDKYKGDDKNWQYCDAHRQYHARFTGQTIKGFTIGGPLTTTPGTIGGRAVLAADVDAYDKNCVKIPISELKVGDKVEFGFEDGPRSGSESTFFVKAIKKIQ